MPSVESIVTVPNNSSRENLKEAIEREHTHRAPIAFAVERHDYFHLNPVNGLQVCSARHESVSLPIRYSAYARESTNSPRPSIASIETL